METEHASLQDGPRPVIRIGDTVHRPVQPWTPAVHALLRHLEAVGFPYSPRVPGHDDEGREVLTFIDGESGPAVRAKVVDDDGLAAFAHLPRAYHDACAGFVPPADTVWSTGVGAPAAGQVVRHGDFAPWNTVWDGGRPVGILDWDVARPAVPIHDIAYAMEYVAPFRDDEECVRRLRYPEPPDPRTPGPAAAVGAVPRRVRSRRGGPPGRRLGRRRHHRAAEHHRPGAPTRRPRA